MKNRSLRKTLIYKNIFQTKKRESGDESNDILIKEIRSVMPTFEETVIQDRIERAHRSRENEYNENQAITAKFNDWHLPSQSKPASLEQNRRYMCRKCTYQR